MGGHIDLYLDVASLYSYIAFVQVIKIQNVLKQHSVGIDITHCVPALLTPNPGNKPPWTLPAKAVYGTFDTQRSLRAVGLPNLTPPGDLMQAGRTPVPLRALLYIKSRHPGDTYLRTWRALLHAFWELHRPPITPDALRETLAGIPADLNLAGDVGTSAEGGNRLFSDAEIDEILKAEKSDECKAKLRETTQKALDQGAFGAPWMWATDAKTGRSEPFFGSDRWSHVYAFLGLPYRDVELLPPGNAKGSESKL
ncbi:thioredoxin-like protein [Daldinia sp. FL1419]|nr:thioredoxin-like protein [Daldinia sp. FL1419]